MINVDVGGLVFYTQSHARVVSRSQSKRGSKDPPTVHLEVL